MVPTSASADDGRVVAFIDIGTNSIRLMLVRLAANHSYRVISLQKEVVRLGEDEFGERLLREAAMERALLVCSSFAGLSRSNGAAEIVAVATSATREARNQDAFVARLRDEAGLDVHVVSGREEARLIYLGVQSRVDLGDRTAFCIDIGGGSTELIVGDVRRHLFLDSLPLGAVRLAGDRSLPAVDGRLSSDDYQTLQRAVRLSSIHAISAISAFDIDVAYGTSGTVRNLAAVSARVLHGRDPANDETVTYDDLRKVVKLLRGMTLEERRQVPGLNPDRADIVLAGAAVIETIMADLGLPAVTALTDCGLREGMLMDYLMRTAHPGVLPELGVRERSVLQLLRACDADERHARHVSRLALELFDSGRAAGLHKLGDHERELLDHAAMLHDIGTFVSYAGHHLHSAYLIANADLLGFDQREIGIMAATALFHRKAPSQRLPAFDHLERDDRKAVRVLSNLLRLAERLDRSHGAVVRRAELVAGEPHEVVLRLQTRGNAQLELWGLENRRAQLEKAFGRTLRIEVDELAAAGDEAGGGVVSGPVGGVDGSRGGSRAAGRARRATGPGASRP